jgi:uncharacterized protein (TIGR02285 family)
LHRIVVILTAALAGPLAAAQTITWLTSDLPPQYIAEGELAGLGIKDQQLRLISGQVPEYQHRTMRASISRLWYQIQHEDGMCGIGVLRSPEREKIAVFSHRPVLVPGFRLIIRADDVTRFSPFLSEQREVDLEALLNSRKLVGGYVADRHYPPAVTAYIASDERRAPLEKSVDNDRLFQLLRGNRVDFVFGLAYEAAYFGWRLGQPLAHLPIKDTPRNVAGYTACSDQPLGRAMIARLDSLQADETLWRQWMEPLRRWLDPSDFAAALAAQP